MGCDPLSRPYMGIGTIHEIKKDVSQKIKIPYMGSPNPMYKSSSPSPQQQQHQQQPGSLVDLRAYAADKKERVPKEKLFQVVKILSLFFVFIDLQSLNGGYTVRAQIVPYPCGDSGTLPFPLTTKNAISRP